MTDAPYDYKEHYDAFYTRKGAYHWRKKDVEVVGIINEHFLTNKSGKLLDIGCGDGWVLHHYAMMNKFKCYGIDVSEVAINMAKEKFSEAGLEAKFYNWSATKLRFEGNQFDTVLFVDCIEHLTLEDGIRALKEIYYVLKPGGELIICTPNLQDEYAIDKKNMPENLRRVCPDKLRKIDFSEPGHHLHEYERDELKFVVKSCGFELRQAGVGGKLGVVLKAVRSDGGVDKFHVWIPYDKQFLRAVKPTHINTCVD